MFISETLDPDPRDVNIYNWLLESYDVDIASGDEVNSGYYTKDYFRAYDFVFVSELISSSDTDSLKGAPAPIFYTECWAGKWDITGWVPNNNVTATYYGKTPEGENAIKIIDSSHPLASGIATDDEITFVTSTAVDDNGGYWYLTFSRPDVDHIPIAVISTDETKTVVFGVEAGTEIYNAENLKDGLMVSENRCAVVGIHAQANEFMTEDAFTLIQAGIDWILEPSTAIEDEISLAPNRFQLEQNYPNPFNPTTTLSFTLAKKGRTLLTVRNILGQEVATLVDADMSAGQHTVTFNGENLQSGFYFYTINLW